MQKSDQEAYKKLNPKTTRVILDFDLTLTNSHTHNLIIIALAEHTALIKPTMLDVKPKLGETERTALIQQTMLSVEPKLSAKETVHQILDQGFSISIATNNKFHLHIKQWLKEKLALTDKQLAAIDIHAEDVDDKKRQSVGKNALYTTIAATPKLKTIVILDDGKDNVGNVQAIEPNKCDIIALQAYNYTPTQPTDFIQLLDCLKGKPLTKLPDLQEPIIVKAATALDEADEYFSSSDDEPSLQVESWDVKQKAKQPNPTNTKIAIDFDNTLVKGFTYNLIGSAKYENDLHRSKKTDAQVITETMFAQNPTPGAKLTMQKILDAGFSIDIVTSNKYHAYIKPWLEKKLGLSTKQLQHVNVIYEAHKPEKTKNDILEPLLTTDIRHLLYIDDRSDYINGAKQIKRSGYNIKCIQALENQVQHFNEALKHLGLPPMSIAELSQQTGVKSDKKASAPQRVGLDQFGHFRLPPVPMPGPATLPSISSEVLALANQAPLPKDKFTEPTKMDITPLP